MIKKHYKYRIVELYGGKFGAQCKRRGLFHEWSWIASDNWEWSTAGGILSYCIFNTREEASQRIDEHKRKILTELTMKDVPKIKRIVGVG